MRRIQRCKITSERSEQVKETPVFYCWSISLSYKSLNNWIFSLIYEKHYDCKGRG